MNARLKAWLPYLLLLLAGIILTAALQGSEAQFCRRYLCPGRVARSVNLAAPWLAAGFLGLGWWAWRRRPGGGLASLNLIAGGCLALVSVVQIGRYQELEPFDRISLAAGLAGAAPPPTGLTLDWESPAILPLNSYLLLPPQALVSDYVTFRQAGERTVRGGLALNVFDRPELAQAVFRRLAERLPAGTEAPSGDEAYGFSRGREQHLAFQRCRAVVYLWLVGVDAAERAAFAAALDQWLAEVACDR
jgi:hypothetical protein